VLGSHPHDRPGRGLAEWRTGLEDGRDLYDGDPFDASTRLGPLVRPPQRERVRGYIHKGESEGPSSSPAGRLTRWSHTGTSYPTVFSNVTTE